MLEFEVVSLDQARLKTASGSRGVREYVIQRLRGNLFGDAAQSSFRGARAD